jgi:hypothetical protein
MIILHAESAGEKLGLQEIRDYLERRLSARVRMGDRLLRESHAEELARIRVLDVHRPFTPNEPMAGEIAYEKRVIRGEASSGVLYDGYRLQELYRAELSAGTLAEMHVVFTDRFFGTYDPDDLRYHGRVIVLGYPTLISLTGLVEAPAKPREYYIARRLGPAAAEEVLRGLGDRYLDYNDPRIPEVLKGYVMQGVFYHFMGEAFCSVKTCRLYNAHWQEELLRAQLTGPEFCRVHERMLPEIRRRLKKFLRH